MSKAKPEQNIFVEDERGDELPALITAKLDDYGLDVFEFRIYSRLARRAGRNNEAFESIPKMAKACKMSEWSVKRAIAVLLGCRLIIKREARKGFSNVFGLTASGVWLPPGFLPSVRESVDKVFKSKSSKSVSKKQSKSNSNPVVTQPTPSCDTTDPLVVTQPSLSCDTTPKVSIEGITFKGLKEGGGVCDEANSSESQTNPPQILIQNQEEVELRAEEAENSPEGKSARNSDTLQVVNNHLTTAGIKQTDTRALAIYKEALELRTNQNEHHLVPILIENRLFEGEITDYEAFKKACEHWHKNNYSLRNINGFFECYQKEIDYLNKQKQKELPPNQPYKMSKEEEEKLLEKAAERGKQNEQYRQQLLARRTAQQPRS